MRDTKRGPAEACNSGIKAPSKSGERPNARARGADKSAPHRLPGPDEPLLPKKYNDDHKIKISKGAPGDTLFLKKADLAGV